MIRQLTPWATSSPLVPPQALDGELPAAGDLCPECGATFTAGETIHKVLERPGYVCHRHAAAS